MEINYTHLLYGGDESIFGNCMHEACFKTRANWVICL